MESLVEIINQAEQGDADAQFVLGTFYDEGIGVAQNYLESMHWLRKAAAQGHAAAQCSIGFNYATGRGVSQNYDKARASFLEAAEQNNAKAQFNLGLMCLKMQGARQNYADAAMWFRKAADQGHTDAKVILRLFGAIDEGAEASDGREARELAVAYFAAAEQRIVLANGRQDEPDLRGDRDVLTGMLNRGAMLKALQSEIDCVSALKGVAARVGGFCVVSIGVDPLKNNDVANRDAVLCGLADRLAQNLRRSDIVGRVGGEDFAVCTPAITLRDAMAFTERFQQSVAAEPFETPSGPLAVTVSIGVAAFKAGDTPLTLLERANAAMHASKKARSDSVKERPSPKEVPNE